MILIPLLGGLTIVVCNVCNPAVVRPMGTAAEGLLFKTHCQCCCRITFEIRLD